MATFQEFIKGFDEQAKSSPNQKTYEKARSLGAGGLGATLASTQKTAFPNRKYRVNYGYINENRGEGEPLWRDEQNIEATDFDDAMDKYKKLAWLREHDDKGRRYVRIQTSDDDFKTLGGTWFYDNQRY